MRSSDKKNNKERWGVIDAPVIPDWEAAHIFLEVARCGSFRAAALKLNQSVNALRRRIDEFEQELGVPLLVRHVNGVQPTDEGSKIFAAVLQMESASFNLLLARKGSDKQIEGEVRIAVTEGLGTAWMLPRLIDFQRANPKLTVNLKCGQTPPDLLRLEADLSIQLERPKEPDLKVVKLGRLHVMLFASRSYLEAYGYPASAADLTAHRFAVMEDEQRRWEDFYHTSLPDVSPAKQVMIRNNVSSAHFYAVLGGAGIGALPSYVQAIGANLVPLHLGINSPLDIWLTYRADAKRIARIRQVIEWATEIYDPRRYPWFRDEFIHPDRFASMVNEPLLRHPLADLLVR
jgi:DNA-binding transcriptional LysR family regulator